MTAPRASGLIALAAVGWGTSGTLGVGLHDRGLDPATVAATRLAVAGVALTAATALRRRVVVPVTADAPTAAGPGAGVTPGRARLRTVFIGAGLGVYQLAFFAAIGRTGVAVSTLVALGAAPLLVAIGARVVLGEELTRATVLALPVAAAGLVLLAAPAGGRSTSAVVTGAALSLVAAACYAVLTLAVRAIGTGPDVLAATRDGIGLGGALLVAVCLVTGQGPPPPAWTSPAVLALGVGIGVVSTAVPYALYFTGLGVVPAARAALLALFEPITATVLAVVVVGEHVSARGIVGAALIVAAMLLATR